jgi:dolichol-phosphate mannosyltransferase
MDKVISVATIVDNYSQNLIAFLNKATHLLSNHYQYYEIVLICRHNLIHDQVSLRSAIHQIPKIRVIELANNCDDDIAYSAALNSAIGDAVVLMDFNLDSLETIPSMINNILHEKADVVIGHNVSESTESSWLYWLSRFFYKCASLLCEQTVDFDRTHFSCYSRTAINCILQYKNNIRNLRLLRELLGLRITTLNYINPLARPKNSTLTLRRLFSRIEEIFHLSVKPLRIVSACGFFISAGNIFYIFYILIVKFFSKNVTPGWASISLIQSTIFLALFFSIAIIASYLNIVSQEIQKRPLYTITNEWLSDNCIIDLTHKNVVGK